MRASITLQTLAGAVPDLIGIAGVCLITYGVGQIYSPAGWIVGGAFCVVLALFGFQPAKKTGE